MLDYIVMQMRKTNREKGYCSFVGTVVLRAPFKMAGDGGVLLLRNPCD